MYRIKKTFKLVHNLLKYIFGIRNKKFILLDTPCHGNLGDQAIAVAELNYISRVASCYELSADDINGREKLFSMFTPKNKHILIQGGGFLGDLWMEEEYRFRRILKEYKNNPITVFPQTISFNTKSEKEKKFFQESKRIYESHKDLCIFVREQKSLDFSKTNLVKVNVHLVPDIVTTYSFVNEYITKRSGILMCMRLDKERKLDKEVVKMISNYLNEKYPFEKLEYTDTVINKKISKNNREKYVNAKLQQFSSSKLIITDRLHGMIFAAITNTPCIAFGNTNGKVKGVYQWIRGLDYIRYVDTYIEFIKEVENLNIDCEYRYEYSLVKDEFDHLIVRLSK